VFFEQLLQYIIQKYEGQRTLFSAYHLLKGKKSGQTIQDVGLFRLQPYFQLMPKLKKEIYLEAIQSLESKNIIVVDENLKVNVTEKIDLQLSFDGWHIRGKEHLFFDRVQLVVQTISNTMNHQNKFLPIVRNEEVQFFVRNYLRFIQFREVEVQQQFVQQFIRLIEEVELSDLEKNILVYRLTGVNQIGWTWRQLSEKLQISEIDVQLHYIHSLHKTLFELKNTNDQLLKPLIHGVFLENLLTESTQKTIDLLQKGYSMEQISQFRRLKLGTIEDHIAEFAMYDRRFEISHFVGNDIVAKIKNIVLQVGNKKLKPIKEKVDEASYFQIRLVLAWMEGENHA